jgi:transcriptional regulator with XRE-family HTH domain
MTSGVIGAGRWRVKIPRMQNKRPFGDQLREWRQRRHLSQLDLATDVEISARHLSFVETGRSQPSRGMVLKLAESLDVPLRERNALLVAAGFAPMYGALSLSDPAMSAARAAVELILQGHEPYPALLVDRHWNLVSANKAAQRFLAHIAPELLRPPVNVLRGTLHPEGFSRRIENLAQWRTHVLARLARDLELTADATLAALLTELRGYPGGEERADAEPPGVVVPMLVSSEAGTLSLFSTTTVFGTAVEVTLSELVLEAFYPADEFTKNVLARVAANETAG